MVSETNNSSELRVNRIAPMTWKSKRYIPEASSNNFNETFTNSYNSGTEMAEVASLLPFDPPFVWECLITWFFHARIAYILDGEEGRDWM